MNLNLINKNVLVSGSSRGIGRTIGLGFLDEGARVMFNGRTKPEAMSIPVNLSTTAKFFVADVTEIEECKKLLQYTVAEYGKLDVLVCNVGSGTSVAIGTETESEWLRMFRINLLSTTSLVSAALPYFSEKGGSIICISSICGIVNLQAPLAYSASKAALISYMKGMTRFLSDRKIRINVVAPGNIFFEGSVWERNLKEDPENVKKMLEKNVPLKRLGSTQEIADFCLFLASERASFATGAVFVVDGGQTSSSI